MCAVSRPHAFRAQKKGSRWTDSGVAPFGPMTLFASLALACVALRCWRADYNDARPHSQFGWKTPSEFAATSNPRRDLVLRPPRWAHPTARTNSGLGKTW